VPEVQEVQKGQKELRVNKDVAACFNLQAIFLQMIANG
jgi:hypothetical protein